MNAALLIRLIGNCNWENSSYSHCFEDLEYKQISQYKSTQFCRQYPFLILLGQSRWNVIKSFTPCRLFPVVHPLDTPCFIGQRGQKPSPCRPYKGVPSPPPDQNVRYSGLYSELKTTQSRTNAVSTYETFLEQVLLRTHEWLFRTKNFKVCPFFLWGGGNSAYERGGDARRLA